MARLLRFVTNPEQVSLSHRHTVLPKYRVPVAEVGDEPRVCAGCAKAKAYRLPVHQAFFEGRSDQDWFLSISSYLEWRAGVKWRPARHTGSCEVQDYRDAIRLLDLAFNRPKEFVRTPLGQCEAIAADNPINPATISPPTKLHPSKSRRQPDTEKGFPPARCEVCGFVAGEVSA